MDGAGDVFILNALFVGRAFPFQRQGSSPWNIQNESTNTKIAPSAIWHSHLVEEARQIMQKFYLVLAAPGTALLGTAGEVAPLVCPDVVPPPSFLSA